MPGNSFDWGDVPAWIAIAMSGAGLIWQKISNSRQDRDRLSFQRRVRVDQITKDIDELLTLSIDYWMRPGSETGTLGLQINIKIRDLSSRISEYSSFLWSSSREDFMKIKMLVTGGSFQSPRRAAVSPTDLNLQDITTETSRFKANLRRICDGLDIVH